MKVARGAGTAVTLLAVLLCASPLAADSIILGPDCGFSEDAIRCRFEEGWTVFVGRVVTSHESPRLVLPTAEDETPPAVEVSARSPILFPRFVTRFAVERIWQGERRARELEVESGGEAICPFRYDAIDCQVVHQFVEGHRYLVFARNESGMLSSHLSSGNYALGARSWLPFRHERPVSLVDSLFRVARARASHGNARP